jgi:hypothetical protein
MGSVFGPIRFLLPVCRFCWFLYWFNIHLYMHIFLSNYWWQESDIWSQASYRDVILWEAFLDSSDSYFLFSDLVGFFFLILTNILQFYPSWFFLSLYWQTSYSFIPGSFDTHSIHIFGLVYYLSTARNSPFYIRCYTYGNQCFVLFQVHVYKWKNYSLKIYDTILIKSSLLSSILLK